MDPHGSIPRPSFSFRCLPSGKQLQNRLRSHLCDASPAENKERALNETRAFATQSLASVAYQIDSGASRLLLMLDTQEALLRQLGASVNHISQCVAVHKEKVSRREIGVLTTSKRPPRHTKLVAPPSHPPHGSTRYLRTKINYSVLDNLGHGAKTADDNEHSLASHSIPPSQKPPSPPIHHKPMNRHSPFRTMDPSRPPVIPNEYSASPTRSAMVRPRAYSPCVPHCYYTPPAVAAAVQEAETAWVAVEGCCLYLSLHPLSHIWPH
uniref:Abl-interactor homeo-domain homologous domain-containing protein n=1 Tax=Eptatretus burgeri TaxID=7764 RepID=A0A8C4PXX6_EPTBU